MAVGFVKKFIMDNEGGYKKEEKTIKAETAKSRKGHADKTIPLIDTAQMIHAVTHVIVEK